MAGLCWRNIDLAVRDRFKDIPEPEKQKKIEEMTKQIYYIYIFLDMYARMDDLRSRGLLSSNDEQLAEWKRAWFPNLVGSEVGLWMLDHDLMSYYSERMNKDLREAAESSKKQQTIGTSEGF